ncbi:DUF4232 domain-containing protein [Pseudonocardia xinjiangensis]|uniref:DUF4232 domain-containing protein n=1 Tax=Pseudonocardia xinjiangensis TaxID=75289 RepID=UPI003D901377
MRWAVAGFVALAAVAGCSGGAAPPPASASASAIPAVPTEAPTTSAQPAGVQPTGGAQPTGSGGSTGPQRCTTAELSVSLGQGDAGAGSVMQPLVFTNTGSRTCELRGFPGVSYVAGDDGHQVGPAAEMSGDRGPEVPIAPRGTAVAQLRLVNVLNFDEAACRPTPVRGLRVYPPGDTASIFVPREGQGCSVTPPDPQLFVQTITRP